MSKKSRKKIIDYEIINEIEYTLLISIKYLKRSKISKQQVKLRQFQFYLQDEFQKVINTSKTYSEIIRKLSYNNDQIFYSGVEDHVEKKYKSYLDKAKKLGYKNIRLIKTNIPLGNGKTQRLLSMLIINDINKDFLNQKIIHRKFYVYPFTYEDLHI